MTESRQPRGMTILASSSAGEIRLELERVLASRSFVVSRRLSDFLRFVVEHAISGQDSPLKEYLIGVEALGRRASFDPQTDPIVRVEASRLRSKLKHYYQGEGKSNPIRISLPKGGYAPSFHARGISLQLVTTANSRSACPERILVLPIADLSPTQNQSLLCEAVRAELVHALTKLSGFVILADLQTRRQPREVRTDASRAKAKVAAADFVLEGSLCLEADRIRIAARLVDPVEGCYLWAGSCEGELARPFSVQRKLAASLLKAFETRVFQRSSRTISAPSEKAKDSHSLYLRGRFHWNTRTEEGMRKAIGCFKRAIELDPAMPLCHSGLADCYSLLATYGVLPPCEVRDEAVQSAAKSVELGHELAQTHASMGHASASFSWNWVAAEKSFRRALNLQPGYALAHHWYAITSLVPAGRLDEALRELEEALESDPVSLSLNRDLGMVYYFLRHYSAALEQFAKTLELSADFSTARWGTALVFAQEGRFAEAASELERALAVDGEAPRTLAALGHLYGCWGKRQEATDVLDTLDRLSDRRFVSPVCLGLVYAGLGDEERAVGALERAHEVRAAELAYLGVDPRWDSLRPNQVFSVLLGKLGVSAPTIGHPSRNRR